MEMGGHHCDTKLLEHLFGATHHARLDLKKAAKTVASACASADLTGTDATPAALRRSRRRQQQQQQRQEQEQKQEQKQKREREREREQEPEKLPREPKRANQEPPPPLTRQRLRESINAVATEDHPETQRRLRDLGLRKCSKCSQVLALDRFRRNARGKPVLNAQSCNACRRVRQPYSDPLTFYAKYLVSLSKRRAKKLGLPHDIDPGFVIQKYKQQNGRCVLCGRRVTLFNHTPHGESKKRHFHARNISLDQIVPAQGYTRDNVQIVDRNCNFAKCNMTDAEFIDMCRHVANTHGHKPQLRDPYEASEESVVMPPDFV